MKFHDAWILTGGKKVLKGWVTEGIYRRVMNGGNPLKTGQPWDFYLDDNYASPKENSFSIRQVLAIMEAGLPVACKN